MHSWFNCQRRECIFLMLMHNSSQWHSELFIFYTILNRPSCSAQTLVGAIIDSRTLEVSWEKKQMLLWTPKATLTGFRNHKGQVWLLDIFQTSTKKQTPHCAKPETVTCSIQIYNCKQCSNTWYQIFSDNCHLQLKTRQLWCTRHHWPRRNQISKMRAGYFASSNKRSNKF